MQESGAERPQSALATLTYRWRWPLSLVVVALVVLSFVLGLGRVMDFSERVASLSDTSNGSGAVKPLAFNPTMDIWFGENDPAVGAYRELERTFVAEDFVMVTFEVPDTELGVFDRRALATIARLTKQFLTIPGVRHVRSLTYSPWIRWGTIRDESGDESGLIISDLVQVDPMTLTDDQIVERMIATLGAKRVADRIGDARVRAVIGADADYADHAGEPLLLGTILNESATTTAIQVQVLRPFVPEAAGDVFDGAQDRALGPALSSIEQQRAAVRGIEHFLRIEQGLATPTPERAALRQWIESMPHGAERERRLAEWRDPRKNFMRDADGVLRRKFFEYDRAGDGYVDRSEPSDPVEAPAGFEPNALSPYTYHLGGVPIFERNFEEVGVADAKYVPLMFLVIIIALVLVFRSVSGVVVPLTVVFGSIAAMVGATFAVGSLLNNMTMTTPNMLTAVGIADAIHLMASWYLVRGQFTDRAAAITEVIRRNALPVFLTSLTTAIGFYSLTTSEIEPVKQLGRMVAFGTFFAWALSMTVVPAALSLIPHRRVAAKRTRIEAMFTQERATRLVDRVIRHRVAILVGTTAVFLVALVGVLRMEIDTDFRGMFPDDNRTMSDFSWIESRIGGVGDLDLIFEPTGAVVGELSVAEQQRLAALSLRVAGRRQAPDEFEALTESEATEFEALREKRDRWNRRRIGVSIEFLATLDRLERRFREEMAKPGSPMQLITDFASPLDTLRKIHQVQNQNRGTYYRIPNASDVTGSKEPTLSYDDLLEEWSLTPGQDASTLVAQYYLQYENGARPGESLSTQLSADRIRFRMEGRVMQATSVEQLRAFDRMKEIVRAEFPQLTVPEAAANASREALATMTVSGRTLLFARTSDLISNGFMKSLGVAICIITVLIGIIFRSLRFAAISLIPNVLPIMMPLSLFGLFGWPLDGPSIFVSSVALGVCVDDTIHFFTKYSRATRVGKSSRDALAIAIVEAGAAMSVTTVVLIIGFATLLLSDFSPNFQMGGLAAVMIGLAWFADFIVTTAVLSFGGKRREAGV